MKKWFVSAPLMACIGFVVMAGCVAPSEPDDDDLVTASTAEMKAHYRTLPPAEQQTLWRARLGQQLASDELTPAQREVVADLRANLEAAMGPEAEKYEARLRAVMSEAEMEKIVSTLELRVPRATRPTLQPQSAPADCSNRWGCSNTCSCQTDQGPIGDPVYWCYQSTCTTSCAQTSSGCGWFWTQSCNNISGGGEVSGCAGEP
ncbi:Hypothetical protein A7982_01575 [Minicystis rosea]|nr:Hypothetical protein A7982_01575 [Minicystis rosea]